MKFMRSIREFRTAQPSFGNFGSTVVCLYTMPIVTSCTYSNSFAFVYHLFTLRTWRFAIRLHPLGRHNAEIRLKVAELRNDRNMCQTMTYAARTVVRESCRGWVAMRRLARIYRTLSAAVHKTWMPSSWFCIFLTSRIFCIGCLWAKLMRSSSHLFFPGVKSSLNMMCRLVSWGQWLTMERIEPACLTNCSLVCLAHTPK